MYKHRNQGCTGSPLFFRQSAPAIDMVSRRSGEETSAACRPFEFGNDNERAATDIAAATVRDSGWR